MKSCSRLNDCPLLLVFYTICLLGIQSCGQSEKTNSENNIQRKVDPVLNQLIKKYPNYQKNEIVRNDAALVLQRQVDSLFALGYFNDIPLEVFQLSKNKNGKGAIAHFKTDNYNTAQHELLSNRLNFDLIGFLSIEEAAKIDEKKKYYVYGKRVKRLSIDETRILVDRFYNNVKTEITTDSEFNLGVFACEIDSFRVIESKRNKF